MFDRNQKAILKAYTVSDIMENKAKISFIAWFMDLMATK